MQYHSRDLLMLNKLRAPVGNMRIFIRIRIRILQVVQTADPQSADPHYTCSPSRHKNCRFSTVHFHWQKFSHFV